MAGRVPSQMHGSVRGRRWPPAETLHGNGNGTRGRSATARRVRVALGVAGCIAALAVTAAATACGPRPLGVHASATPSPRTAGTGAAPLPKPAAAGQPSGLPSKSGAAPGGAAMAPAADDSSDDDPGGESAGAATQPTGAVAKSATAAGGSSTGADRSASAAPSDAAIGGDAAGSSDDSAGASTSALATPAAGHTGLAAGGAGRSAVARLPVPSLVGLLDGILPQPDTDYGLVLEDLVSGARVAVNDGEVFPSASLYKLGVAWTALRQVDAGTLSLDAPLEIQDEDTIEPEPDGGFGAGDTPTVREALEAMLSVSSNAAAHAFLRVVGRSAFTDEMDRIGLTQTHVPDDSVAVTSAADIAHLLRLVATSSDLSTASHALLRQSLANIAPPDALRDTLPDGIEILDKTGNLDDASNVGALLESERGTAILVVVDTGVDPGDARAIIAQAGLAAYHALLH